MMHRSSTRTLLGESLFLTLTSEIAQSSSLVQSAGLRLHCGQSTPPLAYTESIRLIELISKWLAKQSVIHSVAIYGKYGH